MWNWLTDNPDKKKKDWPGWQMDYSDLFSKEGENHCFLCGYVSNTPEEECFNCPLDWGATETCLNTDTEPASYFSLYCDAKTEKEGSKYASIIAKLPEIQEIDVEPCLK